MTLSRNVIAAILVLSVLVTGLVWAVATAPARAQSPATEIDDFTSYTYKSNSIEIGGFAEFEVTRIFQWPIKMLKLTIVEGTADDVGYVGSREVAPSAPGCNPTGEVTAPIDVTDQVTVSGNTASFKLRAKEDCLARSNTGWGSLLCPGCAKDAKFRWQVTLEAPTPTPTPTPNPSPSPGPSTCVIVPLESFPSLATQYCSDLAITEELEANAKRTDLYSQSMRTAIADFQARLRAAGFTGDFLSGAFRTKAYQAHLRDVWDKWHDMTRLLPPPSECSEIFAKISDDFARHNFAARPGNPCSSRLSAVQHTVGKAIDVNLKKIKLAGIDTKWGGQLDQIAREAGFYRPYPVGDPVHFEPMFPVPIPSPPPCAGACQNSAMSSNSLSDLAVAPVRITVSEQSINGRSVYMYRVVNNSLKAVRSLTIGYDKPNDNPELAVPPVGWDFDDGIPESSATSPMGWSASIVPTEESDYLHLAWVSDSPHSIPAGQTAGGFSVVLPNADNSYKSSHWTVVLSDGTSYSGSLEPLNTVNGDTVQFSQAVYAVNKDAGHATITVTRSGNIVNSATVNFATSDGTAKQPNNYTMASGILTFASGEASKSFNVHVINNLYLEPPQTINLNLSNATGVSLGNLSSATLTINRNSLSSFPPQLFLESSGLAAGNAAALDSLLFLRDPFQVVNGANLLNRAADPNTRVVVFVVNLQLAPVEPPSSVLLNLIDSNNQSYDVSAEDVRTVPDVPLVQITFRLPDSVAPGICDIRVKVHNQLSNVGTIRIQK